MKIIPKLGLIVIWLLLTGLFSSSFAQSHNVKALGCKYHQKGPDVAHSARVNTYEVCHVCEDKKEKERIAKQAEDKRRQEELVAKTKAENERKAKEATEKARIEKEKNKPVNAVIAMSPGTGKEAPKTDTKKDNPLMEKNYFYSTDYDNDNGALGNYFNMVSHHRGSTTIFESYSKGFTINGKQYFEGKYRACIGSNIGNEFPSNIGIIVFDDERVKGHLNMDIVDINGKRFFNDNQIDRITHIYGNLFLIVRGVHRAMVDQNDEMGPAYIYNIKTKKKHNIVNFSYVNNGRPVTEANVGGVYNGPVSYYQDWSIECVRYFECEPEYRGKGLNHVYCFTMDNKVQLYQLEYISGRKVFKHLKTLDFE